MEALINLPKTLLDIALRLLQIKKDDRTRQRLADLLCEVADCVSEIGKGIENSRSITEKCAELTAYANHIHEFVEQETDTSTADTITYWLRHVEAVPGVAEEELGKQIQWDLRPGWTKGKRQRQAAEIKEIAGLIRGIGNLVRV